MTKRQGKSGTIDVKALLTRDEEFLRALVRTALQLQSQLSLGSYRTAWMLAAKLRRAMVNPAREPLSGMVEADETIIPFRTKNDPVVLPAGRNGVGKMLVAGAVEIDGGKPRRARLKVIEGFGKQELHAFVLGAVAPQTQLVTDDWPSYQNLPGVRHNAITLGPMAAHIALPWVHRLFSNLKRWGLVVYHGLRKTNLQHYLDEFVFRFNRRRTVTASFIPNAAYRSGLVPNLVMSLAQQARWLPLTVPSAPLIGVRSGCTAVDNIARARKAVARAIRRQYPYSPA